MASQYTIVKKYNNWYGIDLKSSDLSIDPYADTADNLTTGQLGTLEKRTGYHPTGNDSGPLGMFVYNRINPSTGVEEPEVLSVSDELKKLKILSISLNYSGSGTSAQFSLHYSPDAGEYIAYIVETTTSGVQQYPTTGPGISLGNGLDDLAPVTITNLITAINALGTGQFSASLSAGNGSVPAAYIETQADIEFVDAAISLDAKYWETVNSPGTTAPFAGAYAKLDDTDFEPASSVQAQNSIFFATGQDSLKKYDGQNVYRAGVPSVTQVSGSAISHTTPAGSITGNNYQYRIQYIQKDANGVLVEGNAIYYPAQGASLISPIAQNISLTNIPNILASSGFNTGCAVVDGAQSLVNTIVVDNGSGGVHTMKVGDTAYFYDSVSLAYVEREIIAVDTTAPTYSITVAGAAVTVANNAVISNNLKIALWRNESASSAPTVWYLVAELPNNSFTPVQSYVDSTTDVNLGVEFIEPVTDRSPPQNVKYLTMYQGLMFGAGLTLNPNFVSWSDIENVEYWPYPANNALVKSIDGDRITAISASNDILALFQSRAIYVLSGDVVSGAFRIEQLTNDIGCVAHQSIRDIRGRLFFLSALGPRTMSGGQVPTALGVFEENTLVSRIDPLFQQDHSVDAEERFSLSRAWAFHNRANQQYWLFIPAESEVDGIRYCNGNSQLLMYDYSRDSWVTWKNINAAGGVVAIDNDTYFVERSIDPLDARRTALYRFHTTGTNLDYQDHTDAISCVYKAKPEFLGEASLLKNFIAFRLWTIEQVEGEFTVTVKTETNFIRDNTISEFTLTVGADGYGLGQYGVDPYGDPQANNLKHKLSNGRTQALRTIMENAEPQQNIVVTGYELEVAVPYKLAMKS